ncbi:MAG: AsmA-like C-terminal region-containing protein, partial [Flavihumibacter sp.]
PLVEIVLGELVVAMEALGGSIGLNGSYSTKESKLKPDISFQYQLNNLDVEQTFKAFNTVKALMPVGQFISGKMSSGLLLNGKLGDDMMPQLPSLSGNGNLLLIDGFLSKFKPLEELAGKFQITELEKISLKDIKTYFEFVKGKVMVKPFKLKVADIEMEIGGMHGFDQSIDYLVNMKVPRAKLGSQANQLVDGLAADLSKKGLPVKLGETVNIKVNMGGSITQPKLQYNLQSSGSSLADEVKSKADSVITVARNELKDSIQSIKKQAVKDVEKAITDQLSGKKDTASAASPEVSTPKKAEEAAKGILNNLLKKKKNSADSTQKQ